MLLLVPSRLELDRLVPEAAATLGPWAWPGRRDAAGGSVIVARCGVGVAVAGVRTAAFLASTGERSVLLVGLAGSFDGQAAPLGTLLVADRVELHGIGVGEGEAFRSLAEVGGVLAEEAGPAAGPLELAEAPGVPGSCGSLLSVTSASMDAGEASARLRRHPGVLGEDMESWPVARAAADAGAPCTVLRGLSNRVGDRDHARWRTDEAFSALRAAIDWLTGAAA